MHKFYSLSVYAGITGSLLGTSSFAQNAVSSSFATSASYALSSNALLSKAGSITNTSFTGNPRRAPVIFTTPFSTTNYAITISGEDSRAWSIEGKVVGGFTASANSNVGLAGTTYWIATAYGEA